MERSIRALVAVEGLDVFDVQRALPDDPTFELVGVTDGVDETVRLLQDKDVDVMLVACQGREDDRSLQIIDGAHRTAPDVPIIVLSTSSPNGFLRRAFEAGAADMALFPQSKEQLRFNRLVADETAQATYDGIWFSALHRDLREYVRSSQRVVNGQVRLRLDHGRAIVVGRRSDDSLYDRALATYDADDTYDHGAAVGFIRIFGLPLKTEAARHGSAWTWTEPRSKRRAGRSTTRDRCAP